jgi:hypothetical protein
VQNRQSIHDGSGFFITRWTMSTSRGICAAGGFRAPKEESRSEISRSGECHCRGHGRSPGPGALRDRVAARTSLVGQLRVKVVDATTSDCRPAASMVWGPDAPAIRAAGMAPSQVKVPVSEAMAEHTLALCFPDAEPV